MERELRRLRDALVQEVVCLEVVHRADVENIGGWRADAR